MTRPDGMDDLTWKALNAGDPPWQIELRQAEPDMDPATLARLQSVTREALPGVTPRPSCNLESSIDSNARLATERADLRAIAEEQRASLNNAISRLQGAGAGRVNTIFMKSAQRTLDDLLARIDTSGLTPQQRAILEEQAFLATEAGVEARMASVDQKNAAETMGEDAAKAVLRSQSAVVVVDNAAGGSGKFDLVGYRREPSELIVQEAKGGTSRLGIGVKVLLSDGRTTYYPQGSTAYFNKLFARDTALQEWLRGNPHIARRIRDGRTTVRYQLTTVDASGRVGVEELQLDRELLDLMLPISSAP